MIVPRSPCVLRIVRLTSSAVLLCASALGAQTAKPTPGTAAILTALDASSVRYSDVAKQIWNLAEAG